MGDTGYPELVNFMGKMMLSTGDEGWTKMTISAKFKPNHFPNFHRHPLTPPTFIGFNYCIYNSEIFVQILPTFTNFLADSSVARGARRSPRTCRALCLRPSAARAQWCEPRLRGAWGVFGTQKRWKDIINHQTSTKLKSYLFLSVFWWLYGGLIFSFLHQQDWSGFPHEKNNEPHSICSTVIYPFVGS